MTLNSIVFSEGPVEVYQNLHTLGFYWRDKQVTVCGPFASLYDALDDYRTTVRARKNNVVELKLGGDLINVDFVNKKRIS